MAFVVDASVAMAWCFVQEVTPYTQSVLDRLQDTGGTVPLIWPLEVANTLLVGERRGRITQAESGRFLTVVRDLPLTIDDGAPDAAWGTILPLGRAHNLSAYDAAYLELAMRQGLSLATQDARLRAAATAVGVPLVE